MNIFSNDPKMLAAGARFHFRGTSHYWYEKDSDSKYIFDEVSESVIRRNLTANRVGTGPIVLNIEHKDGDQKTLDHLETATAIVRDMYPGIRLGWYRYIPKRDYWTPVKNAEIPKPTEMEKWTEWNKRSIERYGKLVDFLCPSLYTFYKGESNLDEWKTYADANLRQCAPADKPNYAWVWPSYHNSGSTPIPDPIWREQLRFLKAHSLCDGVFVFTKDGNHDWQTTAIDELLK